MTKKTILIGVGNCGNQIANLGEKLYSTLFDTMYINTSSDDLAQVKTQSPFSYKIGPDKEVEGSGKDREKMQEYLEKDIEKVLADEKLQECIVEKNLGFVIGSLAGGTGSGAALIMTDFLKRMFPDTNFIPVGVLPKMEGTSLLEHGNTLEYLDDLYEILGSDTTYMLYDNDTRSNLPDITAIEDVNKNIIEDLRVLTGIDNFPTPYESIDPADMDNLLTTPGRLLVVRVTSGLTEKCLEDNDLDKIIIKAIKDSCHVETDRNKCIARWGVITNFTKEVNALYKSSLDGVCEFIGTPPERFNHNAINTKDESLNFLYLIAAGLSPINDRVKKITAKMEKLKESLPKEQRYILSGDENASYSVAAERAKYRRHEHVTEEIDTGSIFSRYKKKK